MIIYIIEYMIFKKKNIIMILKSEDNKNEYNINLFIKNKYRDTKIR